MRKAVNYQFIPNVKYRKMPRKELMACVEKAKTGDQDCYEKILCHMHNYLCYVTTQYYIQGAEAQDVYQEGAVKLLNVIDKYDKTKGSFITFAQSSIKKHIITSLNKENALKRTILNISYSLDNKITDEQGEEISVVDLISNKDTLVKSDMIDPLDIVQRDYEEYLVEKISEVLSEMEKKVFYLRFMKALSYKEVAKELGLYKTGRNGKKVLDPKSVDNAIWRSRPKIKKVLEKLKLNKKRTSSKEKKIGIDQKVQNSVKSTRGRNVRPDKNNNTKNSNSTNTRSRFGREPDIIQTPNSSTTTKGGN